MSYYPLRVGQQTMADSQPVVIASNQSTLPVSIAGSIPLATGAATSANQATEIGHLAAIQSAVEGTLDVSIQNASIPVAQSGTWNVNNISGTISLPTGAATSANQATEIGHLSAIEAAVEGTLSVAGTVTANAGAGTFDSNIAEYGGAAVGASNAVHVQPGTGAVFPISDNGGAITVDGTVSAAQSGAWDITNISGTVSLPTGAATEATLASVETAAEAIQTAVEGTLDVTGTVAATQSGTWDINNISGTISLPTGAATESTLSSLNGKVTACNTSNVTIGAALPAGANSIGAVSVNNAANNGVYVQPGTGASFTVTMTSTAISAVTPGTGNTNLGSQVDSTAGATKVGVLAIGVRDDALSTLTPVDNDYVEGLRVDSTGAVWTHVTSIDSVVSTAGNVANDAADSGNPVKIGGRALTGDLTAVANNDRVDAVFTVDGKQVIQPYAVPQNLVSGATSDITNTTSTSVIAAGGAGFRNYITQAVITNSSASVGTFVNLTDGSGGTVLQTVYAASGGGGASLTFPSPLRLSDNTALHAVCVTTGANVRVSASGYRSNV